VAAAMRFLGLEVKAQEARRTPVQTTSVMEKLRARLVAAGGDATLLDGWSAEQIARNSGGRAPDLKFTSPCGQGFVSMAAALRFLGFATSDRQPRTVKPLDDCVASAPAMDELRAYLSGGAAAVDDGLLDGWAAHTVPRSPIAQARRGATKHDTLYVSPSGSKFWSRAAVERFLLHGEERHAPRAKQARLAAPARCKGLLEKAEAVLDAAEAFRTVEDGYVSHDVPDSGLSSASGIEIVPTDAVCEACGEGDDEAGNEILLCDGGGCEAAFHLRCLPVALSQVPLGDWLCPACASPPPLSSDAPVQVRATIASVEAMPATVASVEAVSVEPESEGATAPAFALALAPDDDVADQEGAEMVQAHEAHVVSEAAPAEEDPTMHLQPGAEAHVANPRVLQGKWEKVQQLMKCAICLETLSDPVVTPCFHAFCAECIEAHLQRYTRSEQRACPVCRAHINSMRNMHTMSLVTELAALVRAEK